MRHFSPVLLVLVLVACGKGDTPPAPETKPAPAPETKPAPAPETKPAPAPETKPAPAPETKPAPEVQPAPAPAGDVGAYLVWATTESGYETSWIGADGSVAATRPQAFVFAAGTAWGVEPRWTPYRDMGCEEFGGAGGIGPKKHLSTLVARGLAGTGAGKEVPLAKPRSTYLDEDAPDQNGVFKVTGEHWGRTTTLEGGAGDGLWIMDCEGVYGCGAHGDWGCGFGVATLSGAEAKLDLAAAQRQLEPDTKAMIDAWTGAEDDDVGPAELEAVALLGGDAAPRARYRFAAGVAYAGTAGDWGAYTQSKDHVGPIVSSLGLPEVPGPVAKQVATLSGGSRFGWSVVPAADVAATRAAFDDRATLPPAPPIDEAPVAEADADKAKVKVNEGRKLTRDKKLPEAIAAFDAAIALVPGHARAWSGRGYAKLLAGDLAGARADLDKALTLDGQASFQAAVHFNLGELAEKEGAKDQALAAYKKANELKPSDAAKKRIDALERR